MGMPGPKPKKEYSPQVQQQAFDEIQGEMANQNKGQKLSKKDRALQQQANQMAKKINPELQQLGLTDTRPGQKRIVGRDMKINQLEERMANAKEHGHEMDAQVAEYRRDFEAAKRDSIKKDMEGLNKDQLANNKKPSKKSPDIGGM